MPPVQLPPVLHILGIRYSMQSIGCMSKTMSSESSRFLLEEACSFAERNVPNCCWKRNPSKLCQSTLCFWWCYQHGQAIHFLASFLQWTWPCELEFGRVVIQYCLVLGQGHIVWTPHCLHALKMKLNAYLLQCNVCYTMLVTCIFLSTQHECGLFLFMKSCSWRQDMNILSSCSCSSRSCSSADVHQV